MKMCRISADRDLEVVDVRSLLLGPCRPSVLHLISELHADLMSSNIPEDELEDLDDLIDRLAPARGAGPMACLMIAGRNLLCDEPQILAFSLVDYYPASRCAMMVATQRSDTVAPGDAWIGSVSLCEALRELAVASVERLAGTGGLKGVFTECRDIDAEGLEDPLMDCIQSHVMRRSKRESHRMRDVSIGWEMVTVPIDYVRPAIGMGCGSNGRVFLCFCADRLRKVIPNRETILAFLVEIWTSLSGRPPSRNDEFARRMLAQTALL